MKSSLGRSTSNRNVILLQFGVLIAHIILALIVSVEISCLKWIVLAKSQVLCTYRFSGSLSDFRLFDCLFMDRSPKEDRLIILYTPAAFTNMVLITVPS